MRTPSTVHQSHPAIVKRLKRVAGHLRSVVAMIEQQRPCVDIAQQLHAVEKAIAQAKKSLVHDHIDHCLEHSVRKNPPQGKRSIEEFKVLSKYL
jgi:DNA-binding FrmR family transcriptional regulator